jgi:chlorobactene glucosyltransferase
VLSGPWTYFNWVATPSTAATIVFAVATAILFVRARQHYWALPLLPATAPSDTLADCMVVIPARNEEGVVGRAVKSFPPDSVIVVDDHSTDGTAAEASNAGAGVLEAPPLVKGASGKASACMAGARILTSRWILFADADTRYKTGFLESAVQFAETSGLTLLSVHLTPRPKTLAEHFIEPYTTALFFSGASVQTDPAAMFNGQCILARREAYEFLGGHAAVWKYLAEDVKLALLAQQHHMNFGAARAGSMGYVRNYAGWKGLRSGIERNTFRFVQMNPRTGITILITALGAALWLPLAAWLWADGHRAAPALLALLVILELRPWYRRWICVLLAPLAIYAALPMLLQGLISALADRPIEWKGRTARAA